jgi:hypothetical protein
MSAYAALPVASVDFLSWEKCDVGCPATGEPKFSAPVTATSVTCDKLPVNRDWSIDYHSFRVHLDTEAARWCSGVEVWNNEGCAGKPDIFVPLDGERDVNGLCLPDTLEPTFISFKLACEEFSE